MLEIYKEEYRKPFPVAAKINSVDRAPKSCRITWSLSNFEKIEGIKFATNSLINYDEQSNQINSVEELPDFNELNNE